MKTIDLLFIQGLFLFFQGYGQFRPGNNQAGDPCDVLPGTIMQVPNPGDIVINQLSPAYNGASDEYIELLNKTNQTYDLSLLKIAYQSASGNTGSAGGTLSGMLGPYQFWLLSPNATITVGQTTGLPRDGAITAGMASTSGQVALRLKNAPNTIIDGVAYGTLTVNNLGEGTPLPSPPVSGGFARIPDGTDTDNNISDLTLIQNGNIDLRNSSSLHITGNYTLPALSYANITLSGASPEAFLSGNTVFSGKLTIHSGTIYIDPGQCLTVGGTIIIDPPEGLVIRSDATGTGSFLPNGTISGTARAERHISGWTSDLDGWHFLSSPVDGQAISPHFTDPTPGNYDFYRWNEAAMAWQNQKVAANNMVSFVNGEGYLVSYSSTTTKYFSGNLNASDIYFSGLSNTSNNPNYYGWHLLGNPFSCALKWNDGVNWDLVNVSGVAKLLNSGGTYTDVPANGLIPSMNGFMIEVLSAANSIKIPKASRQNVNAGWYKDDPGISNRLLLKVSSLENSSYAECVVQFDMNSTQGFDADHDSHYLGGFTGTPWFFAQSENDDCLSTISMPPTIQNAMVMLGFKKGSSGSYKITATGLETFDPQIEIYLEDNKTNALLKLINNSFYIFAEEDYDFSDRFRLHFGGTFGIDRAEQDDEVGIFSSGKVVHLYNKNRALLKGNICIYDLPGRKLINMPLCGCEAESITMNVEQGYYLAVVRTDKGIAFRKIYID